MTDPCKIFRFAVDDGPCCPEEAPCECSCSLCDPSGEAPCCWKVVLAGSISNDGCSDCSSLLDTFYLQQESSGSCVWQCLWHRDIDCLDSDDPTLTLYLDGSDYKIKVEFGDNRWVKSYGASKPSCCDIIGDVLTHEASGSDCDTSSTTCTITRVIEPCICPSCPGCIDYESPLTLQATLSGYTAYMPDICDGMCPNLNDTFIFTRVASGIGWDYWIVGCMWEYDFDPYLECPLEGGYEIRKLVLFTAYDGSAGSDTYLVLGFWGYWYGLARFFEITSLRHRNGQNDYDCMNLDVTLTNVGGAFCNHSSAQAVVTNV
ncbi:hypothetical protein LCGC14_2073790 [marine sediment metagenome]|uniref:Uncharacterized protein n=1 Tax=marine sediment metagenome TaxID=412755 RepID=A0A0F9EHG9_9ZZZZ